MNHISNRLAIRHHGKGIVQEILHVFLFFGREFQILQNDFSQLRDFLVGQLAARCNVVMG
jgi:hypothetical protein